MPTADEKFSPGHRIAFAVLMLSVAAVFWRHLFTSDVLFFRDIAIHHFPRVVELRTLLGNGQLPLWNPFEHFGESVVATAPKYLLFYPTTWLAWALPPAYGVKLHYVLHFFLAAAGSFLLARRIGLSPLACYAAGAIFVFSGPVMSLGNFYNMLPAVAWMPLVVLAADYQMRRGGWRGASLLAASLALQLLASGLVTSLATVGLALGWALTFHAVQLSVRAVAARFLGSLGLAGGLAAIQWLPAVWHMRDAARAAGLTYEHTYFWSLHPLKLLELAIPEFWGNPLWEPGVPWVYLEGSEASLLLSVFVGILPLSLALVAALVRSAVWGPTAGERARATNFWIAVSVVSLLLALGRFTPLSQVFYHVVPVFRILRFPVKLLVPFTLAVAQLAALGVEYLRSGPHQELTGRRLRRLGHGLLAMALAWAALAAFTFGWPEHAQTLIGKFTVLEFDRTRILELRHSLAMERDELLARATDWVLRAIPARAPYVLGNALLLAAILAGGLRESLRGRLLYGAIAAGILQLISVHYTLNPLADRRYFETVPPVMRHLASARSTAGANPIFTPARIYAEPRWRAPWFPEEPILVDLAKVDFLPTAAYAPYVQRLSLQVCAGSLGLEDTFVPDTERLLPQPQALVNNLVYRHGLSGEPLVRLLRLGSVEFVVLKRFPPAAGLEQIGSADDATTVPVRVYRVRHALPRVYLVREAELLPVGMPTIHRLLSPQFDPTRQVVLPAGTPIPQRLLSPELDRARQASASQAPAPAMGEGEPSGEARLLHRDALRVEVAATTSVPAYLVLTDSYHPDWKVEVDGNPARLLRANQIFRAVALSAGSHRVVFRYRPASLLWGAAVSLATALAIAFMAWRQRRSTALQGGIRS